MTACELVVFLTGALLVPSLAVADGPIVIPAAVGPAKSAFVKVTWKASATKGVTGYDVYRAPQTSGVNGKFTLLGSVTGTSYKDTSVVSGKTYEYEVSAVAPACTSKTPVKTACGMSLPTVSKAVVVLTKPIRPVRK